MTCELRCWGKMVYNLITGATLQNCHPNEHDERIRLTLLNVLGLQVESNVVQYHYLVVALWLKVDAIISTVGATV